MLPDRFAIRPIGDVKHHYAHASTGARDG
jgi:hypothetical protein